MSQMKTIVTGRKKRNIPEGTWIQCPGCKSPIFNKAAETRLRVCPSCDHHMYMSAHQRIAQVLDDAIRESCEQPAKNVRHGNYISDLMIKKDE